MSLVVAGVGGVGAHTRTCAGVRPAMAPPGEGALPSALPSSSLKTSMLSRKTTFASSTMSARVASERSSAFSAVYHSVMNAFESGIASNS